MSLTKRLFTDETGKDISDKLSELINATWAISGGYNLTDAKSIVKAIRSGNIDKVPNGSVFVEHHEVYGDIYFVTRAKNQHHVVGEPNRPTITIQSMYLLSEGNTTTVAFFVYDRPEAFYTAEEVIPSGTVCKFTNPSIFGSWEAGTYHFTVNTDIPVGAKICTYGSTSSSLTSRTIRIFANAKSTTTYIDECSIDSGDGDATLDMGTWGEDTNTLQRIASGSGNDAQSNIFQFLNADTGNSYMDSVFIPQTEYDMMDSSYTSIKGFLGGFSDEFRSYLGLCAIPNITNTRYEETPYTANGQAYTYNGYFFLPSLKEIYGVNQTSGESDETQFDYYKYIATTDADKIMYVIGTVNPSSYHLRTPESSRASQNIASSYTGGTFGSNGFVTRAISPLAILA